MRSFLCSFPCNLSFLIWFLLRFFSAIGFEQCDYYDVLWSSFLHVFVLGIGWSSWIYWLIFIKFGKFLSIISSNNFSIPHFFLLRTRVIHFVIVLDYLKFFSSPMFFHLFLFSLCITFWIISSSQFLLSIHIIMHLFSSNIVSFGPSFHL